MSEPIVEIRQKFPGGTAWVVLNFDGFFNPKNDQYVCVVRSQKEKDVMDGYCLVYGVNLKIVVGRHTVAPVSDDPYLFLWVVSVQELT